MEDAMCPVLRKLCDNIDLAGILDMKYRQRGRFRLDAERS